MTDTLSLLKLRRSVPPQFLSAPGPQGAQLDELLAIAARVPDHGKLAPWRFVHVRQEDRGALEALLMAAYRENNPDPMPGELEAVTRFARQAPCLVVVLSKPVEGGKIPVWEQHLSAGAACMNILTAAHAMGYAGGWITGWPTYSETVRKAFGEEGTRIAGFLYLGTPAQPLEERPRPDFDSIVSDWTAP